MRAVLLTGGWAHPADATVEPLCDLLGEEGFEVALTESVDALAPLLDEGADLLAINACRFRMLDDRYTDEQRDEWATEVSPMVRAAITDHLRAGRPMLGLHAATICFDDWTEWRDLLGGAWRWDRSGHGPVSEFRVTPVADHAVTEGLAPFDIEDECYAELDLAEGSLPILRAEVDGQPQSLGWLKDTGAVRIGYSALGHDERSLRNPDHQALLRRLIAWLTGESA